MRISVFLLSCLLTSFLSPVKAANVINGWSSDYTGGPTKIIGISSYFSATWFKLQTSAGCGADEHWSLPIPNGNSVEADRYKRALLVSAYVAGKRVSLRCENSAVTDFQVVD